MKYPESKESEKKSNSKSGFLGDFIKTILASLVGATLVLCADIAKDIYLNFDARNLKETRKERLEAMLCDPHELKPTGLWRNLKTLSIVVGLKEENTVDLLVELGARGGARQSNQEEGNIYWGLMSLHPIDKNSRYYELETNQRYKYVKENYQGSICNEIYQDPEFKI